MAYIQKLAFLTLFFSSTIVIAINQVLAPNDPASVVFTETLVQPLTKKITPAPPAELSYLFADLKYRDGILKICEFGEGKNAARANSTVTYNGEDRHIATPYWPLLWEYLGRLNLPVWLVGKDFTDDRKDMHKEMLEISQFKQLQGKFYTSLNELQEDSLFNKNIQMKSPDISNISSLQGILIYRHRDDRSKSCFKELEQFKQQ